ncbi:MAG: ABC transporter ATP-binding protein [bacterium]|nr:ABC transporter ATP-binding protein [bacterium]
MSLLTVTNLTKHFGGLAALASVSMTVEVGERRAIIGPNGAGKSTFFNLIAGELLPTSGQVQLEGQDITKLPVNERANLGLGHTFQRNNLFLGLTTFENVYLAVQHHQGITKNIFKPAGQFSQVTAQTTEILQRVGLLEQQHEVVSTLAYGQQRALEVALALATEPKVLLLDEPTAGMSPAETTEMAQLIENLPHSLTMMIVEHDMDVVFSLANKITVLHYGQKISNGTPAQVRADPIVQEIYLGAGYNENVSK